MGKASAKRVILKGKDVITPEGVITDGFIEIADGTITRVGSAGEYRAMAAWGQEDVEIMDETGKIISPGFIDIHVHGGGGHEFSEGTLDAIEAAVRAHAQHGTTALLATPASLPQDKLANCARAVKEAMGRDLKGAQILGMHLEGPWLNPTKKGAQDPEAIRRPDIREFEEIWDASGNSVRHVTMAPEVVGGFEMIRVLKERGITISAGHSAASYEQVLNAIKCGLTHTTHAFNGMVPLHHRDPGLVGAILTRDELTTEMIVDGFHLHAAIVNLLYRCKGRERLALVTDSIMAAGMPEGTYHLAGLKVKLSGDGSVRLADGTLAGSILTMDRAVSNTAKFLGVPIHDVIPMASIVPARIIGVDNKKGSLEVGKDADIVVLDDDGTVHKTIVRGQVVYSA
ncbi:MAG TPA: N-acetylglucosamine-6-phosphate deacetylase [Firmicutes bacterium]|nr:N-acetylglucosamine-6-phosphate deacetylase [Bacillota bacterium]